MIPQPLQLVPASHVRFSSPGRGHQETLSKVLLLWEGHMLPPRARGKVRKAPHSCSIHSGTFPGGFCSGFFAKTMACSKHVVAARPNALYGHRTKISNSVTPGCPDHGSSRGKPRPRLAGGCSTADCPRDKRCSAPLQGSRGSSRRELKYGESAWAGLQQVKLDTKETAPDKQIPGASLVWAMALYHQYSFLFVPFIICISSSLCPLSCAFRLLCALYHVCSSLFVEEKDFSNPAEIFQ